MRQIDGVVALKPGFSFPLTGIVLEASVRVFETISGRRL